MTSLLLLAVFSTCTTFAIVIDTPCPVDPPCACDFHDINCDKRGLTRVPDFKKTNLSYWRVDLSSNNITNIPSLAFMNLTNITQLNAQNNKIEYIAENALTGSGNTLTDIRLGNNRLTELPLAIGHMKRLDFLHIDGNPIRSFNPDVVKQIAATLESLTFGSPELTTWPFAMQYLTNVSFLTIRNVPMKEFPTSFFLGLDKVWWLELDNCSLTSVPLTLNMLASLQMLNLDGNPGLTLNGFPSVAFNGLPRLNFLSIRNQSFDTLPDIFLDATNVNYIDVDLTPIRYIEDSLFPENSPLGVITLNDTLLDHIPSAITQNRKLTRFGITNSPITRINSGDLRGLHNLTSIDLSSCPLSHVAEDAFDDLYALRGLSFDNTELTTIPKALLGLKYPENFQFLGLYGNRIFCDCTSLVWLNSWRGYANFIPMGECVNLQNTSIQTYIRVELPKCP